MSFIAQCFGAKIPRKSGRYEIPLEPSSPTLPQAQQAAFVDRRADAKKLGKANESQSPNAIASSPVQQKQQQLHKSNSFVDLQAPSPTKKQPEENGTPTKVAASKNVQESPSSNSVSPTPPPSLTVQKSRSDLQNRQLTWQQVIPPDESQIEEEQNLQHVIRSEAFASAFGGKSRAAAANRVNETIDTDDAVLDSEMTMNEPIDFESLYDAQTKEALAVTTSNTGIGKNLVSWFVNEDLQSIITQIQNKDEQTQVSLERLGFFLARSAGYEAKSEFNMQTEYNSNLCLKLTETMMKMEEKSAVQKFATAISMMMSKSQNRTIENITITNILATIGDETVAKVGAATLIEFASTFEDVPQVVQLVEVLLHKSTLIKQEVMNMKSCSLKDKLQKTIQKVSKATKLVRKMAAMANTTAKILAMDPKLVVQDLEDKVGNNSGTVSSAQLIQRTFIKSTTIVFLQSKAPVSVKYSLVLPVYEKQRAVIIAVIPPSIEKRQEKITATTEPEELAMVPISNAKFGAKEAAILVTEYMAEDVEANSFATVQIHYTWSVYTFQAIEEGTPIPPEYVVCNRPAKDAPLYLYHSSRFNFNEPQFSKWMNGCTSIEGDAIAKVQAILTYIRKGFDFTSRVSYQMNATNVIDAKKTNRLGFHLLFVAACRFHGIAARLLVGQIFKNSKAISSFRAECCVQDNWISVNALQPNPFIDDPTKPFVVSHYDMDVELGFSSLGQEYSAAFIPITPANTNHTITQVPTKPPSDNIEMEQQILDFFALVQEKRFNDLFASLHPKMKSLFQNSAARLTSILYPIMNVAICGDINYHHVNNYTYAAVPIQVGESHASFNVLYDFAFLHHDMVGVSVLPEDHFTNETYLSEAQTNYFEKATHVVPCITKPLVHRLDRTATPSEYMTIL